MAKKLVEMAYKKWMKAASSRQDKEVENFVTEALANLARKRAEYRAWVKTLKLKNKRYGTWNSRTFRKGAAQLKTKRDELLQEVLEIQNKINEREKIRVEDEKLLKRRLTQVFLCEKIIGNFGVNLDTPKEGA